MYVCLIACVYVYINIYMYVKKSNVVSDSFQIEIVFVISNMQTRNFGRIKCEYFSSFYNNYVSPYIYDNTIATKLLHVNLYFKKIIG